MKALYVTSLVLSVALMVFGAVLLSSAGVGQGPSSVLTSENYAGGSGITGGTPSSGLDDADSTVDKDVEDGGDGDEGYITLLPTDSSLIDLPPIPSLEPTKKYLRVVETVQPSSVVTIEPSTNLPSSSPPTTKQPSEHPTQLPTIDQTAKPSIQSSDSPSDRPSSSPTAPAILTDSPTDAPTQFPSAIPTNHPSTSVSPTLTNAPTTQPFKTHSEPLDLNATYFNYNTTVGSNYGPSAWGNVKVLNSTNNYWSEFGLVTNQCNDPRVGQSPIDVCTSPVRHCLEYHEFRSKVSISYA